MGSTTGVVDMFSNEPPIDSFSGEYRFLSNFYDMRPYGGLWGYPSSENAYQAAKFYDPDVKAQFLHCTPSQAKRLGQIQTHCFRRDWDARKLAVMEMILLTKFSNPQLRAMLLDTGTRLLVEGNTWNDTFWGVCGGRGQNQLGYLLMLVREHYHRV